MLVCFVWRFPRDRAAVLALAHADVIAAYLGHLVVPKVRAAGPRS
jgi:hypothetical protein